MKKYHPDGTFDKYKCGVIFRGDRWYDLYNSRTYAGTVMSETVCLMLSIAATEDMEIGCLDVKTTFLYVPDDQYIYMRWPAGFSEADMPAIIRLRLGLTVMMSCGAGTFPPTVSDPRVYVR